MPQVSVTINGRAYPVACNEGEETRITALAREIDDRVTGFARQLGQAGEARLLVLAALVLADELADAREAQRQSGWGQAGGEYAGGGHLGGTGASAESAVDEAAIADYVERIAERIEAVAAQLETGHI